MLNTHWFVRCCGLIALVGCQQDLYFIPGTATLPDCDDAPIADLEARLDRDVISKKPDWMTLSCGVNDVWHGKRGVNLEDYKKNIASIIYHISGPSCLGYWN